MFKLAILGGLKFAAGVFGGGGKYGGGCLPKCGEFVIGLNNAPGGSAPAEAGLCARAWRSCGKVIFTGFNTGRVVPLPFSDFASKFLPSSTLPSSGQQLNSVNADVLCSSGGVSKLSMSQ